MMQRLLQFTLDLFEPKPAPLAAPVKLTKIAEKQSDTDEKAAVAQVNRAPNAIKKIAKSKRLDGAHASQALAQVLVPTTFRHPRATRQTLLDGILVAYAFQRGKRRTIGFSAGPDGLAVSAPKWVPLYEIDKAILEKSDWILKKLQETRARHEHLESARIDWKDGCSVPFLGDQVVVVVGPQRASGGIRAELKSSLSEAPQVTDAAVPHLTLHVALPHDAAADQIRDVVQTWLMQQAKRLFTERLDHFAPALGVQWRTLSLSSARTRWGSASANGSIRLNWRLVHFKLPVIDYVVAHELSHLRVMDHSPRFWDTVRTVVPNYADLRRQLKNQPVPRW